MVWNGIFNRQVMTFRAYRHMTAAIMIYYNVLDIFVMECESSVEETVSKDYCTTGPGICNASRNSNLLY